MYPDEMTPAEQAEVNQEVAILDSALAKMHAIRTEQRSFYIAHEVKIALAKRDFWPHDQNAYDSQSGEPFTRKDAIATAKRQAENEWDFAHGLLKIDARGNYSEA